MRKIKKRILIGGTILTIVLTGCSKTSTPEESIIETELASKSNEDLIETESVKQTKESETIFVEPSTTIIETTTEETTKEELTTEEAKESYEAETIDIIKEFKEFLKEYNEINNYDYSSIPETNDSDDQTVGYITIDIFQELRNYLHSDETEETNSILQDIKEGFHSNIEEVQGFIKSEEFDEAKANGKEYVTKFIDFLFYGEDINGVTIEDFSESAKQDIYNYLYVLDQTLMLIDEDYKEELGEKYDIVKEYTVDGYNAAKEYIIEQIGQEKYDEIVDKKDEIVDDVKESASSYFDRFINYLDEQYQSWKSPENETTKKYIYKR